MADRSRAERAKMFAPYAALKGYYDMVLAEEDHCEKRRELCEDDAAKLSRQLNMLEKGMQIRVCYHNGFKYVCSSGRITRFEPDLRYMIVENSRISFDDISELERLN